MLAFLFLLCYIMQAWFVGQAVKTAASHAANMGSIPVRVTSSKLPLRHESPPCGEAS